MTCGLYQYIDDWSSTTIFMYVCILIFTIWIFSIIGIGINILIPIIVAWFIISYLNNKAIDQMTTNTEIINSKKELVKPNADYAITNLSKSSTKHDTITNFLFSIQDLYQYNPLQYNLLIHNLDEFYDTYRDSDVSKNSNQIFVDYETAEQYKREALNSLHSMIFSLPDNPNIRQKLLNSLDVLDSILTENLDEISYLVDNRIYRNNYNVRTKVINYGAKAFNDYEDIFKPYSYEIY